MLTSMPSYVAFILFIFLPCLALAFMAAPVAARALNVWNQLSDNFAVRCGEALGLLLYKFYPSPNQEAISAGYRAAELGEAIEGQSLRATLVEDRILFLHEVELSTRCEFAKVDGDTVHVRPKHLRKIEDFCQLSDQYGTGAKATFWAHGYELVTAR